MQLVLNEEQTILRNAANEFFAERLPVTAMRALRDANDTCGFDHEAWREMAAMGWAGVLVPEAHGGSEFGYVGLGQVLEAGGRTLAGSPLIGTALLAAPLIAGSDNAAAQQQWLTAIAEGEVLFGFAIDEGPRHDPAALRMHAAREGDEIVLNGDKLFVVDGHVADRLVVCVRDDDGVTLCLVAADAAGVTRTPTRLVDSRWAANVRFSDVRVAADEILAAGSAGAALLERCLDGARAGMAAEMLGAGLEAFERTLAYLKMREQFDVPIGSFQALKHRAALMFCELELVKSAVMAALVALDAERDDRALLASLAKARACDMLELVTNEAVQMHGGIGMTDDEEIGLFLKRARVQQQLFGDSAFHRQRYAALSGF